jgi:hypothetical protein
VVQHSLRRTRDAQPRHDVEVRGSCRVCILVRTTGGYRARPVYWLLRVARRSRDPWRRLEDQMLSGIVAEHRRLALALVADDLADRYELGPLQRLESCPDPLIWDATNWITL